MKNYIIEYRMSGNNEIKYDIVAGLDANKAIATLQKRYKRPLLILKISRVNL